jgi:hypothetical protein
VVLFIQTYLTVLWNLSIPFSINSAAKLAAKLIKEQPTTWIPQIQVSGPLRGSLVGPIPTIEKAINFETEKRQNGITQFILTDLKPCAEEWEKLKKQMSLSYIADPVDAREWRIDHTPGQKMYWILNISFHHLDDASARKALRNVAESADSDSSI